MLKIKGIKVISWNCLFYLPKQKNFSIPETKQESPSDSFRLLSWSGFHWIKLTLCCEILETRWDHIFLSGLFWSFLHSAPAPSQPWEWAAFKPGPRGLGEAGRKAAATRARFLSVRRWKRSALWEKWPGVGLLLWVLEHGLLSWPFHVIGIPQAAAGEQLGCVSECARMCTCICTCRQRSALHECRHPKRPSISW